MGHGRPGWAVSDHVQETPPDGAVGRGRLGTSGSHNTVALRTATKSVKNVEVDAVGGGYNRNTRCGSLTRRLALQRICESHRNPAVESFIHLPDRANIDLVNILLVSGSTRATSTNAAALASIAESAPPTATTTIYRGLSTLPALNPDDDHDPLPDEVFALRQLIRDAGIVLFCTPEYAGTLPGSFKNLLDWIVGGTEMTDKPVAWINVAAPGRGHGAASTLETVLGYVGARLLRSACIAVPVGRDAVDGNGEIRNEHVAQSLAQIWSQVG